MYQEPSQGRSAELVQLETFVESMPYLDKSVAKFWFGLGDSYCLSITEIAKVFKQDESDTKALIDSIEKRLDQAGLLTVAWRSRSA